MGGRPTDAVRKTVQVPGGLHPHPQEVVGDSRPSAALSRNMRRSIVEPLLFFGRRTVAAGKRPAGVVTRWAQAWGNRREKIPLTAAALLPLDFLPVRPD